MDTVRAADIAALASSDSRVIVVAGNRAEAVDWCTQTGIARRRMIYATRDSVRGASGALPVVQVGTWYNRPRIAEIMRLLAANARKYGRPAPADACP